MPKNTKHRSDKMAATLRCWRDVVDYLTQNPGKTTEEIAQHRNALNTTTRNTLVHMQFEGYVRKEGEGWAATGKEVF